MLRRELIFLSSVSGDGCNDRPLLLATPEDSIARFASAAQEHLRPRRAPQIETRAGMLCCHVEAERYSIAANLRAILAAHIPLQLVYGSRLRPADDVQSPRLMGVAAEAADLEVEISGIQCVAQSRRWLRRSLVPEHALVPNLAGQLVRNFARFGALGQFHGHRLSRPRLRVYPLSAISG
jgi:hypothetical protein